MGSQQRRYAAATPGETAQFKPEAFGTEAWNARCSSSGNVSVTVSEAAVAVTYSNCSSGALNIDGALTVTCDQSGTSVTDTLNGTVAVIVYASDGSIAQQADITFNNLSVSTFGQQTTESGTLIIGGTQYSTANLDYAGSPLTACAALFGGDAGTSSGGDDGGGTTTGVGACVAYVDDAGESADAGTPAGCLVTSVNGQNTSGPPCSTGLTYATSCPTQELVGCCTTRGNSNSTTIVLITQCTYTDFGESATQLQQSCVTPVDDGGAPGVWSTSPPQ